MPMPCSICTHPERAAIDKALAAQTPNRRIAAQYAVGESALRRHKAMHLPAAVAQAAQEQELNDAIDVLEELKRCFKRIGLLFDAADRWLRDPTNPAEYTLEPRADELLVIYTEPGADGKPVRKKEPLAVLLGRLKGKTVERWETKHADPRELILKTAAQLGSQLELVSELMHRAELLERLEALERRMGSKS